MGKEELVYIFLSTTSVVFLWYLPLKILHAMEEGKRDTAFCRGGIGIELNTVRYRTLQALHTALKNYIPLYLFAYIMTAGLVVLLLIQGDYNSKKATVVGTIVVAIFAMIFSLITPRFKKLSPFHSISTLIMGFLSICVVVLLVVLDKDKNESNSNYVHIFWLTVAFLLSLFLAILPATLRKLLKEYASYEKNYLEESRRVIEKQPLSWRLKDAVIENVLYHNPNMSREEAGAYVENLAKSKNALESLIVYTSGEQYAQLKFAKDNKELLNIMQNTAFRDPKRLNQKIVNAVKFTRRQLMGQVMFLVLLSSMLLGYIYYLSNTLNLSSYFFVTILVTLFILWYISTISNNLSY